MPELPEVETMVRGIRPHVAGRTVAALRRCRTRCRPITLSPSFQRLARALKQQRIAAVERIGKRVVLRLERGEAIAIEPRMTGLMLLADPPDREHLRLQWEFADAGEYGSLWFWDLRGLGTVTLFPAGALQDALGPRKLGTDALAMRDDDWAQACARTARPIKVALLDQKLVAGIGNLYASEILHRAGIHPGVPANQLERPQLERLSEAVQAVLIVAIEHEGSTLGDGTYRNALNRNGSYQNAHRVYKRDSAPCLTCREGVIQRVVQAQRSTFFCPRCQG